MLAGCGDRPQQRPPGVVVLEVGADGGAAAAGIEVGDELTAWRRAAAPPANPVAAGGELHSPFDLRAVEIEQEPRGAVTLVGVRDGSRFESELPPRRFRLEVRPVVGAEEAAQFDIAESKLDAGRIEEGARDLERLAGEVSRIGECRSAAWILMHAGQRAVHHDETDRLFAGALELLDGCDGSARDRAYLHEAWGVACQAQERWEEATDHHRRALSLQAEIDPDSLSTADCYNDLGRIALKLKDVDAADGWFQRALSIRERAAPGSRQLAATLNNMGNAAIFRGDLERAEEWVVRALSIRESIDPDSLDTASSHNSLGAILERRGDLAGSERSVTRALEIRQHRSTSPAAIARYLNNLGAVSLERGNLESADTLFRRSLKIQQGLASSSLDQASTCNNLGVVALRRGDLDAAETYFQRSLDIREANSSGGLDQAKNLTNLSLVAYRRGNLAAAKRLAEHALALHEAISPDGSGLAAMLHNLAWIAREDHKVEEAEALLRRALKIKQDAMPGSLSTARTMRELALVRLERGDAGQAEDLLDKVLEVRRLLAPSSLGVAEALNDLGRLSRLTGRTEDAELRLAEAVAVLESQHGRIGDSGRNLTNVRAAHLSYYRDWLELLLEEGRGDEAIQVLERSRAQGMLAMLAERDLVFSKDLPAGLERERRMVAARYDAIHAELDELSPGTDADRIAALLDELRELRVRQGEIRDEVCRRSPALADLERPTPLDLDGIAKSLDPGTVLVTFALGPEHSHVFVVSRADDPGCRFAERLIGMNEDDLADEVRDFRDYIAAGRVPGADEEGLRRRAGRLYDRLLLPVEPWLAGAERIVVCPEGPLHALPFAALARTVDGSGTRQYLVEWKPVHTVVSATLYARLREGRESVRHGADDITVVAFGDPDYGAQGSNDQDAETWLPPIRGHELEALPETRREVEGVARVWGERTVVRLGDEATEEEMKRIGGEADILHVACHGVLDRRFPLDSALVLSLPDPTEEGRANGYLQAWEIFEDVRLDADLVVLSACDTGLGVELGGEGLIGLIRAFQYAGARSVVASLWKVPDHSTSVVMERFHAGLKMGLNIDEALRRAQLSLAQADQDDPLSRYRHPYYWAGLQVAGNWRFRRAERRYDEARARARFSDSMRARR